MDIENEGAEHPFASFPYRALYRSRVQRVTMNHLTTRPARALAETVDFDFIGQELGDALYAALRDALRANAVFPSAENPLGLFREAIATAIGRITENERWDLFQHFLKHGSKDVEDPLPKPGQLTEAEAVRVVSFVSGHMVNSFQGAIAEVLATAPCTQILQTLQSEGRLPKETRLYVGDVVLPFRLRGTQLAKGADMHFLALSGETSPDGRVAVLGVAEVKSYFCREETLARQLSQHIARARRGLRIEGRDYPPKAIRIGDGTNRDMVRIAVLPGTWPLPRDLRWRQEGDVRVPEVVPGSPPDPSDTITRLSDAEWRVVLRWSREALAEAAYEMTFWFMSKIGEEIYRDVVPNEWEPMTPAEAGYNAAKEKLYYAIRPYAVKVREHHEENGPALTRRENLEMQRAIALYNSYCFGYMLGMNFRNAQGKREMLWPKDLDEIIENGKTTNGCRIV